MQVSVYILTYNRSNYLSESINSVLNQTYKDFKLIVLDNHSDDDTPSVVAKYDDPRITYIRHNENIGGINNINFAIQHCNTEYMVVFHDDDIMLPNFLELEFNAFQKYKEVVAVGGNSICFEAGSSHESLFHNTPDEFYSGKKILTLYLRERKIICFPSIMYKTSFLHNHNLLLDNKVGPCADVIFYSDIALLGGMILELSDPVMKTRSHKGQDTSNNYLSMHLKLFLYMRDSKRYRDLFCDLMTERNKAYVLFCRSTFKHAVLLDINKNDALSHISKLADALMIKKTNNIWTMFIRVYYTMPKLLRPVLLLTINCMKMMKGY